MIKLDKMTKRKIGASTAKLKYKLNPSICVLNVFFPSNIFYLFIRMQNVSLTLFVSFKSGPLRQVLRFFQTLQLLFTIAMVLTFSRKKSHGVHGVVMNE